jgi:hypothetical protein
MPPEPVGGPGRRLLVKRPAGIEFEMPARTFIELPAGRHLSGYLAKRQAERLRNSSMMASPMAVVPTSFMPSDMMSRVR